MNTRHCKQCDSELPDSSPGNRCPKCLLELGLADDASVGDQSSAARDGRIGRYKLLQQIGEGGCGIVYMAEQEEPVRRRVALKVIKLGMDTKSVVVRFEAERQALAMMDHPNIARVFDGGATEQGRPYFVMELVRGIKITEYCDQHLLPMRERLELFMQVCQAVQHAHQKGIIHRDLKPSNILVTVNDGVAVPKVIDFGVAKATEQRLTDKTNFTAFNAFIGTPAYMSPEQAEMSSLDIDTRSDIYSLGVLLYELLTSRTPFDHRDLLQSGIDEIRRTIREKEPARPSTRLHTFTNDELTTTAKCRRMEAPRLITTLRGELDWIAMKCLEKDRMRRYATANDLLTDVGRHLKGEAIVARPDSALYRLRKVLGRNKLAFGAASSVLIISLFGLLATSWQAVRATRAEHRQIVLREQAERAQMNEVRLREEAEARERFATADNLFYRANVSNLQQDRNSAESLFTQALELNLAYRGRDADETMITIRELAALKLARGDVSGTVMLLSPYRKNPEGRASAPSRLRLLLPEHLLETWVLNDTQQVLEQLLKATPIDSGAEADLSYLHGRISARNALWETAVKDFARTIELEPADHFARYQLSVILAFTGDHSGQRRHYLELLAQSLARITNVAAGQTVFGPAGIDSVILANHAIKASLITPGDLSVVEQAHTLADFAAAGDSPNWLHPWVELAKALAEYRQEHWVIATDWAGRSLGRDSSVRHYRSAAAFIQAMAHFKLGQLEAAQAALIKADEFHSLDFSEPQSGDLGGFWYDWLIDRILRQEAVSLMGLP